MSEKKSTKQKKSTLAIGVISLRIIGDSPLIIHAWSEKAKRMIRDKQAKKANKGREVRNPQEEYEAAFYKDANGNNVFPSVGLKAAAVRAAKSVNMAMTDAKAAFHIPGEFVPVEGEPRMREDMVRVGMGSADLRYRPEFLEWSIDFNVRYNKAVISAEQLVDLFDIAGFGTGIGDWRPEKGGRNGMFHAEKKESTK